MNWEHPGRKNYWLRNSHLIGQTVPLEAALIEDPVEVMFNGAAEAMRSLTESLRREARGLSRRSPQAEAEFTVSLTEYVHRDFSLVDVTAPNATKGHALAWRAEQLGLTRDQVMAVGDNFNDVEMLEYAGTPVLMANAVEGLRRPGWHVTGHQDDAGLAQAIRKLALDPLLFHLNLAVERRALAKDDGRCDQCSLHCRGWRELDAFARRNLAGHLSVNSDRRYVDVGFDTGRRRHQESAFDH